MPESHIFLTGFMGSGKSSVGKVLADKLSLNFVDLDQEIEKQCSMSINEIFAEDGEAFFRKVESELLALVSGKEPSVIATGGGVVVSAENRRLMKASGTVVNLAVAPEQVISRLAESFDRPLLEGEERLQKVLSLMKERRSFYEEADIQIDTDSRTVEDVVGDIIKFLKG